MLSYLVSSTARRVLLDLLWAKGVEASASELARRARISTTAAQRELGLMKGAGLALARPLGNARVYRANREHPRARVLDALLEPAKSQVFESTDTTVLAWLNDLGAPFWEPAPLAPPSIEAALAAGVVAAQRDASLARVLPVVFWKQQHRVDWTEMAYAASREGVKHELGFFVDMAGVLGESPALRRRARVFRDKRRRLCRAFFLTPGAQTRPFLAEMTPRLAKRWALLMDVDQGDYEAMFRKHAVAN